MHRIDGAGNQGGMFVHEDVLLAQPPTEITADFLNALQEELVTVITSLGGVLNKADNTQLLQALQARFAPIASPVFTGSPQAPTPAPGANDTKVATTAFVRALVDSLTISAYAKLAVFQRWTAGQYGNVVVLADAATVAWSLADGNEFDLTLSGNRTLALPTNVPANSGMSGKIVVRQDATGGRTLAFASGFTGYNGVLPTLTTTAGAVDHLFWTVESGGVITVTIGRDRK